MPTRLAPSERKGQQMAYRVLKHTLRQTATNAAAQVVAALIEGGNIDDVETAANAVNEVADSIFAGLESVADADNAVLAAEQGDEPAEKPKAKSGSSSSKPASKGSSSSNKKDGFTAEQAREVELNYGKFAGETLGKVEELTADEAEEYGYENGDGVAYIKWLATNKRNQFLMKAAKAILADRGEDE